MHSADEHTCLLFPRRRESTAPDGQANLSPRGRRHLWGSRHCRQAAPPGFGSRWPAGPWNGPRELSGATRKAGRATGRAAVRPGRAPIGRCGLRGTPFLVVRLRPLLEFFFFLSFVMRERKGKSAAQVARSYSRRIPELAGQDSVVEREMELQPSAAHDKVLCRVS